jgi:hypothetical protein
MECATQYPPTSTNRGWGIIVREKKERVKERQGETAKRKIENNPTSHAVVQRIFFKCLLDTQHLLNALNGLKARGNQKRGKYKVMV